MLNVNRNNRIYHERAACPHTDVVQDYRGSVINELFFRHTIITICFEHIDRV